MINNGNKNDNRNEWGSIRSVIIRVINGIGRTMNGSLCFSDHKDDYKIVSFLQEGYAFCRVQ